MKEGSIVKTTFDYRANAKEFAELGIFCNNWPSPDGEYLARGIVDIPSEGDGLIIEDIRITSIHIPGRELYFNPKDWREIQPPLNIAALIEESIYELI